jgi:hypothetical protein
MGPLILIDNEPQRWIQPEHVVRVVGVNGSRCIIRFVDDHSIEVARPVAEVAREINGALGDSTTYVRIDQP